MIVEVVRSGAGKKYRGAELKKTAAAVLRLLGQDDAELSLVLAGNPEIRKLNHRYRHKDYATDVLSFPAPPGLPGEARILGDVVISVTKARAQARARGRPVAEELTTLLIHGILHLLGYDHERSAKDARVMGSLERKIYRQLCGAGDLRL